MKKKKNKSLPVASRPVLNSRPIITAPDGQPKPVPTAVPHPRTIIEAQMQNLYLVFGTLVTLEKALNNSDGEHDLAYADCVKACYTMLDVTMGALDGLSESLPEKDKEGSDS